MPFTRLASRTWLHDRPEADVFRLLIDVYRMRIEDDYSLGGGQVDVHSIYGGEVRDGRLGLRKMLRRMRKRSALRDLLPPWWTVAKVEACARFGINGRGSGDWCNLAHAIEKADVIEHYGDARFPMQLRMYGDDVYGSAPGGMMPANQANMLAMMVSAETSGGGTAYMFNMASFAGR